MAETGQGQMAPVMVPTVTVYSVADGQPAVVRETDVAELVAAGTHTTTAPKGTTRKGATGAEVDRAAEAAGETAAAATEDAVREAAAATGGGRRRSK